VQIIELQGETQQRQQVTREYDCSTHHGHDQRVTVGKLRGDIDREAPDRPVDFALIEQQV